MLEQVFLFKCVEVLETGTARQRASAERGAMLAGLNRACDFFIEDDGAKGNAQPKRFSQRNHVGEQFLAVRWREPMKCKPLSRPSQAALDFIHDKDGAFLLRKSASSAVEIFRYRPDAALTLNCLDQNRADVISKLPFEVFDIVEVYELETGYERFELLTILPLSGCG